MIDAMRQVTDRLEVRTKGRGLHDITGEVRDWTARQRADQGLLTLFIQHTSASLTIQENADPDVLRDLEDFFARLVADDDGRYRHAAEGPDDMPAHIRAALTATQLAVPVLGGAPALGTWQGIFVFEHRLRPHDRHVVPHLLAD